jgi:hypothetical protein
MVVNGQLALQTLYPRGKSPRYSTDGTLKSVWTWEADGYIPAPAINRIPVVHSELVPIPTELSRLIASVHSLCNDTILTVDVTVERDEKTNWEECVTLTSRHYTAFSWRD